MTVRALKEGEKATVEKILLPPAVKERLKYLGIGAGTTLTLLKIIARKTYLVQARSAKVALGADVAEGIFVCRI